MSHRAIRSFVLLLSGSSTKVPPKVRGPISLSAWFNQDHPPFHSQDISSCTLSYLQLRMFLVVPVMMQRRNPGMKTRQYTGWQGGCCGGNGLFHHTRPATPRRTEWLTLPGEFAQPAGTVGHTLGATTIRVCAPMTSRVNQNSLVIQPIAIVVRRGKSW